MCSMMVCCSSTSEQLCASKGMTVSVETGQAGKLKRDCSCLSLPFHSNSIGALRWPSNLNRTACLFSSTGTRKAVGSDNGQVVHTIWWMSFIWTNPISIVHVPVTVWRLWSDKLYCLLLQIEVIMIMRPQAHWVFAVSGQPCNLTSFTLPLL